MRFGQGFATCAKQTDSVGTCTPCNSAASADLVESEVEEVVGLVAVCVTVSVETRAGVALEGVLLLLECVYRLGCGGAACGVDVHA